MFPDNLAIFCRISGRINPTLRYPAQPYNIPIRYLSLSVSKVIFSEGNTFLWLNSVSERESAFCCSKMIYQNSCSTPTKEPCCFSKCSTTHPANIYISTGLFLFLYIFAYLDLARGAIWKFQWRPCMQTGYNVLKISNILSQLALWKMFPFSVGWGSLQKWSGIHTPFIYNMYNIYLYFHIYVHAL